MLKVNKGDLVRILDGAYLDETGLNVGDIVEISGMIEHDSVEYYVKGVVFDTTDEDFFLYDNEFELFRKVGEEDAESDAVHHPSHYTQGKFETIEIIEAITQGYDNGYVAYSIGNTLKYLARAPFKHASPVEDLRKAATYLEFAVKAYEAKEALN